MPACSWPQTPALHAGKTGSGWLLGRHVEQQMDIQQPPIAMPQAASQGHRLTRLAEWRGRCSTKGAGCRSAKAAKRRGAAGSKRWRAGGAKPSKGRGCSGWAQGHWHVRVSGNRYRQGMAFARVVHSQKPQTVTVPKHACCSSSAALLTRGGPKRRRAGSKGRAAGGAKGWAAAGRAEGRA